MADDVVVQEGCSRVRLGQGYKSTLRLLGVLQYTTTQFSTVQYIYWILGSTLSTLLRNAHDAQFVW